MTKEQQMLAKKLKMVTAKNPELVQPVKKTAELIPHLIIITTEEKYKVESVLYYSLNIGTEQKVEYDKKDISQELLNNIELVKSHLGYIYFKKNDKEYIPIKEIIITSIKDNKDSIIFNFMVGKSESNDIRHFHCFARQDEDSSKLIFLALMK